MALDVRVHDWLEVLELAVLEEVDDVDLDNQRRREMNADKAKTCYMSRTVYKTGNTLISKAQEGNTLAAPACWAASSLSGETCSCVSVRLMQLDQRRRTVTRVRLAR